MINMRRNNVIITLLLLISYNIYSQENNDALKVELEINGYGITSSETIAKDRLKTSASGTQRMLGETKFISQTDSIPAELETEFGVFYTFKSNKDITIPVTILWEYPNGMKDKEGNLLKEVKYTIFKETNFEHFSNYTLEKNELIKGDWIFNLIVDGKIIYKKVFYLY